MKTFDQQSFEFMFESLTGNAPFPWQVALYRRFISDRPDNIPALCHLPAGLGKTSVMAIWLIAVAHRPDRIPRRLVYVANLRTVVDQTVIEVEHLQQRLALPDLKDLRHSLSSLCSKSLDDEEPVSLSALRGEYADNDEWRQDSPRPAVIVGTVDMIGSRILFSGYKTGDLSHPSHTGIVAQDILLVHDEARLAPAFRGLLSSIECQRGWCGDFRKLRIMELNQSTDDRFSLDSSSCLILAGTVATLSNRCALGVTVHGPGTDAFSS